MQTFDIAIMGGGVAGLSLACFIGGRRSVVLLEREEALGYHSTGRSAAEFLLRYNPPEVKALARISKPFFDAPPQGFADVALLRHRGSLMIASAEKAARLEEVFRAEAEVTDGVVRLTVEEAVARVPFLNPAFVAGVFFDPGFWDIEVDSLMQGYRKSARGAGVEIRERHEVLSARHDGTHWIVTTTGGALRARTVVNASGGWADATARLFGVRPQGIVPHRRTAVLVDLPAGVDAATLPEINEIDDDFYFKPDAGRLMVSPADETPCEPADVQPEEIDIAWAAHHLQQATTLEVKRIAKSWAGMRSFAADRLPVVGFAEDDPPGFFWLAGQGGFGILSSPALGSLAASMLVGADRPEAFIRERLDPARFRPGRF